MAEAIRTAYADIFNPSRGDRPIVRNAMVVVLAHNDSSHLHNIFTQAQIAKDRNIHVVAVGKDLLDLQVDCRFLVYT